MLQNMPEGDAVNIFHRIRANGNVEETVQHVKEGRLLMELSQVPETRLRYKFPYIADMQTFLQIPRNTYLHSLVYEVFQASSQPTYADCGPVQYRNPYEEPLKAAEMIDPLLADARPSKWTSVSSDDRLLQKLLEGFFINEYPWEFVLHKDYFLEDMASGSARFCSPLLVNALLAKACVS